MAYRSSVTGDTPGTLITSATPSADLVAQIEQALTTHDNWDYVEQVTIGTTFIARVWKNRGTGLGANSFGTDYYIYLCYNPASQTYVRIKSSEVYNLSTAATNPSRAIRPVTGYTSSQATNANGSHGDETVGFTLDSSIVAYADTLVVTTGFDWGVLATNNSLWVWTKYSTTDTAWMVGIFDSFNPAPTFPLIIAGNNGNEAFYNTDCGASREPNKPAGATSQTYNFIFQLDTWAQTSGSTTQIEPYIGNPLASRVLLRKYTQDLANYGYRRGLLKDCFYLPDGTSATRNGDTMTMGGKRHVKMKVGNFWLSAGVWVDATAV